MVKINIKLLSAFRIFIVFGSCLLTSSEVFADSCSYIAIEEKLIKYNPDIPVTGDMIEHSMKECRKIEKQKKASKGSMPSYEIHSKSAMPSYEVDQEVSILNEIEWRCDNLGRGPSTASKYCEEQGVKYIQAHGCELRSEKSVKCKSEFNKVSFWKCKATLDVECNAMVGSNCVPGFLPVKLKEELNLAAKSSMSICKKRPKELVPKLLKPASSEAVSQ